jgi:hypothetical protein
MPCGKNRLAEVARDYFFGLAHRSEIDALIPVQQYIDIHRYTFKLVRGQKIRRLAIIRQEWFEQLRDAGFIQLHASEDCRCR